VTEEAIDMPLFPSNTTAFGDYDNDGRPDMFLADRETGDRLALLHNEGDGRFTDRSTVIHAEIPGGPPGRGSIFGDYDNDGDLDLFVSMGTSTNPTGIRNVLGNPQRIFYR